MKRIKILRSRITLSGLVIFASLSNAVELPNKESFSQEYQQLAYLLNKVQDRDSAFRYYDQIATEIQWLQSRQISGGEMFRQLSPSQQQKFIQRFQQNQFHCGVITRVHEEARRIMLDAELKLILEDWIVQIP